MPVKKKREQTAIEGRKTQSKRASSLRLGKRYGKKVYCRNMKLYCTSRVPNKFFSISLIIKHICCHCCCSFFAFFCSCLANLNKNVRKRVHRLIELSFLGNWSYQPQCFSSNNETSRLESHTWKQPVIKLCITLIFFFYISPKSECKETWRILRHVCNSLTPRYMRLTLLIYFSLMLSSTLKKQTNCSR